MSAIRFCEIFSIATSQKYYENSTKFTEKENEKFEQILLNLPKITNKCNLFNQYEELFRAIISIDEDFAEKISCYDFERLENIFVLHKLHYYFDLTIDDAFHIITKVPYLYYYKDSLEQIFDKNSIENILQSSENQGWLIESSSDSYKLVKQENFISTFENSTANTLSVNEVVEGLGKNGYDENGDIIG